MSKRKNIKTLAVILCIVMMLSTVLSACGPVDGPGPESTQPTTTAPTDPTTQPTEPADSLSVPGYEGTYEAYQAYAEMLDRAGTYQTDYATLYQVYVAGAELNKQFADEGFVLLKNENNALPLSSYEAKVTAFGYRSVNLQMGGSGSGAGNTAYVDQYGLYISTLETSLNEVGMELNPVMAEFYANNSRAESDPSAFTPDVINSYTDYNDVALIVYSRGGSEGADLSADNGDGTHSLQLTAEEQALIRHAKQHFDKVVVLINGANPMELGALQEEKTADNLGVDAILVIGHVGVDGASAIGRILTGEVNPSGHTVDIWERNFLNGPSFTNFGNMAQNGIDPTTGEPYNNHYYMDGEDANATVGRQTIEYREDIYMGYRYYETAYADRGNDDAWYEDSVVYPFGYGLSYTTFEWELDESIDETGLINAADGTVTISVKVTNTGDVAGKEVVQIYFTAPYYDGGIEKAAVNLVGFAKTKLLEPGESEVVTVQFAAQDMASFDWNDKNDNGFIGYELEAGEYVISARSDSHTPEVTITRTIEETILCETDLTTGAQIEAVFSQTEGVAAMYNSTSASLIENLLSREGGLDGTQPAPATSEDRTITQADLDGWDYYQDAPAHADDETDPWYVSQIPDSWTQTSEDVRASGTGTTEIQLSDLIGVSYQEPTINEDGTITLGTDEGSQLWNEFMNQLTWEELEAFMLSGGWGRRAIPAIGKPEEADQDGPSQLGGRQSANGPTGFGYGDFDLNSSNGMGSAINFISEVTIAATWNTDLAYEQGRINGNFSLFLNIPGWYGPGMNTHRSPFGGRNFEYYSEDGILAGKIGASVIRGATEKGLVCYPKHMAMNEQETNRSTSNVFVTEQAMREIYLKPFELAVKEGGTLGFMTSMSYIGTWAAASNGALQSDLFRDEWGYKGIFETDANNAGGEYKTLGIMLRNGTDINLVVTHWYVNRDYTDDIVNVEPSYWNPDARNGLGMVMTAADAATRDAADRTLSNNGTWTEGLNGTTEYQYYNWRDKSAVADSLTHESATYYYWLRLAAMHALYTTVNSNAINNGMPSWMYHGYIVDEIDVTGTIGADGNVVFDKTVVQELEIEEDVFVSSAHIASGDIDLPHMDAAAQQMIDDGTLVVEALLNDNEAVSRWLTVNNDGELSIATVAETVTNVAEDGTETTEVVYKLAEVAPGEYTVVITVYLNYFHQINIKVNLTIQG